MYLKLNIAICDDEPLAIEYVAYNLQKWSEKNRCILHISSFSSAEQFLFEYDENRDFDLLFLDIQMGEINGVDLAKTIRKKDEKLEDAIIKWLQPGVSAFRDDTINITMAHVMSYGVNIPEEEFISYTQLSSTFGYVNQQAFDNKAHYTALGHIHQTTTVNKDKNIFYSGSLINQFFSGREDEPTNVLIVDLNKDGVQNIIKQPLNVKPLKKFVVNSVAEAHKVLNANPDKLVKVIIENVDNIDDDIDNSEYTPYITMSDVKNLRKQHPNLVTLSVITNEAKAYTNIVSKKDLTSAEIFEHFVKAKTGKDAEPEVKELFLNLMSEGLYEAD